MVWSRNISIPGQRFPTGSVAWHPSLCINLDLSHSNIPNWLKLFLRGSTAVREMRLRLIWGRAALKKHSSGQKMLEGSPTGWRRHLFVHGPSRCQFKCKEGLQGFIFWQVCSGCLRALKQIHHGLAVCLEGWWGGDMIKQTFCLCLWFLADFPERLCQRFWDLDM